MNENSISRQKALRKRLNNENYLNLSMLGVLLAFILIASIFIPTFFNLRGLLNILAQQSYLIIIGIGVTFLLLTGNFDLSVGGIASCAGVLLAFFVQQKDNTAGPLSVGLGMDMIPAILLSLAICTGIGLINAFFIVRIKIPSVIVTLGTMYVARGIAIVMAQGAQRNVGLPENFDKLGTMTIGVINLPIIIMVIAVIIALIIEKKTIFGRRLYYIGANTKAAEISGINVKKQITILYVFSALMAAFTGVIYASQFNQGSSYAANGYEFDALVATILGGTSILGGFGSIFGLLIGTFILGVLSTCLNQLGLPPAMQNFSKGVILVIAVVAQRFAIARRSSR